MLAPLSPGLLHECWNDAVLKSYFRELFLDSVGLWLFECCAWNALYILVFFVITA